MLRELGARARARQVPQCGVALRCGSAMECYRGTWQAHARWFELKAHQALGLIHIQARPPPHTHTHTLAHTHALPPYANALARGAPIRFRFASSSRAFPPSTADLTRTCPPLHYSPALPRPRDLCSCCCAHCGAHTYPHCTRCAGASLAIEHLEARADAAAAADAGHACCAREGLDQVSDAVVEAVRMFESSCRKYGMGPTRWEVRPR
jgi:hypothetical protein